MNLPKINRIDQNFDALVIQVTIQKIMSRFRLSSIIVYSLVVFVAAEEAELHHRSDADILKIRDTDSTINTVASNAPTDTISPNEVHQSCLSDGRVNICVNPALQTMTIQCSESSVTVSQTLLPKDALSMFNHVKIVDCPLNGMLDQLVALGILNIRNVTYTSSAKPNSNGVHLSTDSFKAPNELESLEFRVPNDTVYLEMGAFQNLYNLKRLTIQCMKLTGVTRDTFIGATLLRELHITFNESSILEPNAFDRITKLKSTVLRGLDVPS